MVVLEKRGRQAVREIMLSSINSFTVYHYAAYLLVIIKQASDYFIMCTEHGNIGTFH